MMPPFHGTKETEPSMIVETTFIGALIRVLRWLPATRQAFLQFAGATYVVAATVAGGILLAKPSDLAAAYLSLLVAFIPVALVLLGTWVRKRVDRRTIPSKRRLHSLLQIRFAASVPRNRTWNELQLRAFRPRDAHRYVFPDPHDRDGLVKEAARLNCAAFANTPFVDSLDRKYRRNGSHLRRNPFAIMLVAHERPSHGSPEQRKAFVGFTHLIPITEGTYNDYIEGKIPDKDFNARHVCSPTEAAHAVLIFSLGLDLRRLKEIITGRKLGSVDRFFAKVGLPPFRIGNLYEAEEDLWRGFFYHAQVLLKEQHFSTYPVIFLAQNLDVHAKNVLENVGFTRLDGLRSADNEHLFEIKLWPSSHESGINR
jgi:hypothetical protein